MIDTYRQTIETATVAQLRELIEHHSMDNPELDEYAIMDVEELREGIYTNLEEDGLWLETVEEDILDSIANGNWNDAGKQMNKEFITVYNLIDFIEEYNEMVGYRAFEWFDLTSVASLCDTLNSLKANK